MTEHDWCRVLLAVSGGSCLQGVQDGQLCLDQMVIYQLLHKLVSIIECLIQHSFIQHRSQTCRK